MENKHTIGDLRQMQSLPLEAKIKMTQRRVKEWVDKYGEDGVYVSFSGGKDSTVLLDIVRKDYPDIKAVFIDTGLEYPQIRAFVKTYKNVDILRPSMNFREVIAKYGYPIIGKEVSQSLYEARHLKEGKTKKMRVQQFQGEIDMQFMKDFSRYKYLLNAPFEISHMCCNVMKKSPAKKYAKKNHVTRIMATMAEESKLRLIKWLKEGCNSFESKEPNSTPMSFWTENDVLTYIHTYNLTIADVYGQVVCDWEKDGLTEGQIDFYEKLSKIDPSCKLPNRSYKTTGCMRTGCIFCGFGITQDKHRFARLSEQEPDLCDYVMRGGEFSESGMWQPSKGGLGYWFVLEWLNVYGNLGIGIPNRNYYMEKYCMEENRKYLKKIVEAK